MTTDNPNHAGVWHLTCAHIRRHCLGHNPSIKKTFKTLYNPDTCICVFTSRSPLLCADSAQYPRVPQVGGHGVAASDRCSLRRHDSASHELRPRHAVTVATLCRIDWEKGKQKQAGSQFRGRMQIKRTQRHKKTTLLIKAYYHRSQQSSVSQRRLMITEELVLKLWSLFHTSESVNWWLSWWECRQTAASPCVIKLFRPIFCCTIQDSVL